MGIVTRTTEEEMLNKKHGKHKEYEMAYIRVEICKTKQGLLTHHQPETKTDEDILTSWKSGGMEQVAGALLNEGVKREIYLAIFSELSQGGLLDENKVQPIKDRVYQVIHKMVVEGIDKMTPMLIKAFDQEKASIG